MSERPLILVSNDDGVEARGIAALADAMRTFADVVTVAPATEQSAGSHSLTLARPLRHKTLAEGIHAVDGTPADCIYLALFRERFLPRWPDLVVSGINHGYNLGTDTFYSGTVAAAREASLRGLRAMAFSLGPKGSFPRAAAVAASLAQRLLEGTQPGAALLLNVNFPPGEQYRGVRAARLGRRVYVDEVTVRSDPRGREYFWIGGPGARHDPLEGSDTEAVDDGFVSVTPLMLDGTDPEGFGAAAWVAARGIEEGRS